MKTLRKWFAAAFAAVAAFCMLLLPSVPAQAATVVDATQNVSAKNWAVQNELKVTYLSLGDNAIPDIGYGMIDNAEYQYAQEYIAINNRSVKDINTDASLGAANWTYTVFPSRDMEAYRLPVILFVNNGKIEIKMHENFVKTLGNRVEITAKAGLYFENGGVRYEVTQDKSFVVWETEETRDITETVAVSGWIAQNELKVAMLSFGEGVVDGAIEYGIMDKAAYQYVQEYILINGRSVKEINTDESLGAINWTYTVFPSTANDLYKVPVIIFVNSGVLEVKLHGELLKTLGDKVEITVKAGLYFENGGVRYEVMQDKSFTAWEKKEGEDITDEISFISWLPQNELKVVCLQFGEGVLAGSIEYGIMDNEAYKYLQEYILINGRSVKEINTDESLGAIFWEYTVFPSTAAELYKVPVILFVNNGVLEIKLHSELLKTLGASLQITVKAGLSIENNGTLYEVKEDKTLSIWAGKSIADDLRMNGWQTTGEAGELTYTMLHFGSDVLPEAMDYGIIDNPQYQYLQEYILINGQSIKTINTETVTDWYEFSTFPSTANDLYKVPVLLFENNGVLEIKFHNTYIRTLMGADIEITVKEGLTILNGDGNYTVDRDVCFTQFNGVWVDKNRTFEITYFLNGVQYGETQYLPFNSPLVLLDDPEVQKGYSFSGWEGGAVASVMKDMEIHGYLRPIRYHISYELNGGKNASVNPIVYYATDGEIVLQDAVKEGAIFKGWYLSADYTQKVESITPDMADDLVLYALFEGGETENGCGATLSLGGAIMAVAVAVAVCAKKKED